VLEREKMGVESVNHCTWSYTSSSHKPGVV